MDLTQIDPDDQETVARTFGIAEAMAAEIMYVNDDDVDDFVLEKVEICGPLRRWESRVRMFRNPSPHAEKPDGCECAHGLRITSKRGKE